MNRPLWLNVAICDGSKPKNWKPFASSMDEIKLHTSSVRVLSLDENNEFRVSILFDEIELFPENSLKNTIGVLFDHQSENITDNNNEMEKRRNNLIKLCRKIKKNNDSIYRYCGFRIIMICNESNKDEAQKYAIQIFSEAAAILSPEMNGKITLFRIWNEELLKAFGEQLAGEVMLHDHLHVFLTE